MSNVCWLSISSMEKKDRKGLLRSNPRWRPNLMTYSHTLITEFGTGWGKAPHTGGMTGGSRHACVALLSSINGERVPFPYPVLQTPAGSRMLELVQAAHPTPDLLFWVLPVFFFFFYLPFNSFLKRTALPIEMIPSDMGKPQTTYSPRSKPMLSISLGWWVTLLPIWKERKKSSSVTSQCLEIGYFWLEWNWSVESNRNVVCEYIKS